MAVPEDSTKAYLEDKIRSAYSEVFGVEKQQIPISLILILVELAIQILPTVLKICDVSKMIHDCQNNTLIARLIARKALINKGLWNRGDRQELIDVLLCAGANYTKEG